jgi:DNA-binding NtrC family response regulator
MSAWNPATFTGRHIVVADEDPKVVAFVIRTLREDGHAVFHAYDVLGATQLAVALEPCDLVISNTSVEGADGVDLIQYLRKRCPDLPIIYLANIGRSTPEAEAQLPADVPILREPFTAEDLRAAVAPLLNGKRQV